MDGLRYREAYSELVAAREEIRGTRPQPEIKVVIDGLTDLQKDTIAELLANPNLEFKLTAIDTAEGKDILLHIRNSV